MKSFDIEREKIVELFGDRPGFTDEVIDAITATYVYLEDKYKELVPSEEIPDVKNFKKVTSPRSIYTIAEIYLNRIYNNVKEIVSRHGPGGETTSQFEHHELKVYVPEESHYSWDDRINKSSELRNETDEQKSFRRRQIRAKVITHELLHAACYNGEFTGFIGTNNINYDNLSRNYGNVLAVKWTAGNSTVLEELITEELALDIVGMNRIFSETINIVGNEQNTYIYRTRNPESSNAAINSAGAYLINAIPGIVQGKFVNPIKFLMEFNKRLETFGFNQELIEKYGLASCLSAFLEEINNSNDTNKNGMNTQRLINIQVECLNIYLQNLKIEGPEDYLQAVKAHEVFRMRAVCIYNENTKDTQICSEINELLVKIRDTIKKAQSNLSKEDLEILKEEHALNKTEKEPYVHIIDRESLEDDRMLQY